MRKFVVFTETDRTISVNQIIADDLWAVEITKCLTLCVCDDNHNNINKKNVHYRVGKKKIKKL